MLCKKGYLQSSDESERNPCGRQWMGKRHEKSSRWNWASGCIGRRRPVEIPGSEYEIEVDTVIMSLGTSPNPLIASTTKGLETNKRKCIVLKKKTARPPKPAYMPAEMPLQERLP